MKKYLYICYLFLSVMFAGCSDWLDYTPKDKQTADQQFSTRDGFFSSVNGVYNQLLSTSLYGRNLTYGAVDLMSKRYVTGTSTTTNNKWATYNYTATGMPDAIDGIWSAAYSAILNANVIIEGVDEQDNVLSESDAQLIKGDLLALRAYLHFDMLRLFGPIYKNDPDGNAIPYNNSASAQAFPYLSARSVIYDYLIPDLNIAEECLRQSDPILTEGVLASDAETGDNYTRYRQLRMNYFATILLKARIYLWAGDTENALLEARKITDDASISTIFPFVNADELLGNGVDPDRVFSSEVLFGFYYADRDDIYSNNFDGSNVGSSSLLQPRATYLETAFPNTADYRFQSQWSAFGSTYNFVKYREISYSEDDVPIFANLMPLMRLSEAYYIASEALAENNPVVAVSYLNTILRARGITELSESSTSTQITNEIKAEYIREMWGEGQIFYMFKRLGMNITSAYNGESTTTTAATAARFVLPLPESEQENR